MTKEEAEYVYQSVKNEAQVKAVHISRKIDKSVDVSVNLYKEALTQEVDGGRSFFYSGWHYGGGFSCHGVFFLVLTLGNVCESVP